MLNPTTTERAADFWSDRQLQQFNDAQDAAEAALERATRYAHTQLDTLLRKFAA